MYSIKQVFKQEPAVIVTALMAWLAVAVVAGWIDWSKETLTTFQSALTGTLLLAWVRQATITKDGLNEVQKAVDAAANQPPPPPPVAPDVVDAMPVDDPPPPPAGG